MMLLNLKEELNKYSELIHNIFKKYYSSIDINKIGENSKHDKEDTSTKRIINIY